ncbi:TPA: hypothetical protein NIH00_004687 [Pseudomonas aeruginosa]|nr:hypothetical protein [Pseudomonas aeruginosa]
MKWYSRISLGLSLAVASAFLMAYWRSLVSHSYPNMNAPGLIVYLLVFPACALLLHSPALAFVLQQRKLGSARERALQWTINLALWMAPLCFIFASL